MVLSAKATAVSLFLAILVQAGQKQQHANLHPLPSADAAILAVRLQRQLPKGASLEIDAEQMFLLHVPGSPDLRVAPIVLHPHSREGEPTQCGVYFVTPDNKSRYIPIVDRDLTYTDMCQEVIAVGIANDPGPHPRLIFIFGVNSGHGLDNILPYVLGWDASTGIYNVDTGTSKWLVQHKGSDTVAGVRKLLAQRR